MADACLPDQTIMAQVGQISPEMIKHYSQIRRQALNGAAVPGIGFFLKSRRSIEKLGEVDRWGMARTPTLQKESYSYQTPSIPF